MSNEKHVVGVCPNCANHTIELGDWENFSGDLGREWECRSCGAIVTGKQIGRAHV